MKDVSHMEIRPTTVLNHRIYTQNLIKSSVNKVFAGTMNLTSLSDYSQGIMLG